MTSKERDILDQLRTELHGYHSDVKEHVARCESCRHDVNHLILDIYGNPDDRTATPGVIVQVADLKKSRRLLLGAAAGAWTLATMLIGTLVSRWF